MAITHATPQYRFSFWSIVRTDQNYLYFRKTNSSKNLHRWCSADRCMPAEPFTKQTTLINSDKIICLIKFGSKTHMERLLRKGELYFNIPKKYNDWHADEAESKYPR